MKRLYLSLIAEDESEGEGEGEGETLKLVLLYNTNDRLMLK